MKTPLVTTVPCLSDNYAYLVRADGEDSAWVVDPSEAAPVQAALDAQGLRLAGILCTHHHFDHVGGNEELVAKHPGIPVIASAYDHDRVPAITRTVVDDERLALGALEARVITVPGHTLGAVAFVIGDAVFTGDTLFLGGCGRLFEGTPAMMFSSLCERLAKLPPATRVFCGHEYTASNARFALHIEPDNAAAKALLEAANARGDRPTVPGTIGAELLHNPFMRVEQPAVIKASGATDATDPAAVLGAIRLQKDSF